MNPTEIPKYITEANEDFSGLDAQCNIAEKKLTTEEGLYVLDLKSKECIDNLKLSQIFEHMFTNVENKKECISILDRCLLGKES